MFESYSAGILCYNSRISFTKSPLYHSLHYVPPGENKCLWLIYIYLLLANLMLFCQSIDVVITNDTFYWFLSKSHSANQNRCQIRADLRNQNVQYMYLIAFHDVPPFCCRGGGGHSERDPNSLTGLELVVGVTVERES